MAHCKILHVKHEENAFAINVECNGPARNQLVAIVKLTPRPDQTIDFADQDQSYKAVLYRCPQSSSRLLKFSLALYADATSSR